MKIWNEKERARDKKRDEKRWINIQSNLKKCTSERQAINSVRRKKRAFAWRQIWIFIQWISRPNCASQVISPPISNGLTNFDSPFQNSIYNIVAVVGIADHISVVVRLFARSRCLHVVAIVVVVVIVTITTIQDSCFFLYFIFIRKVINIFGLGYLEIHYSSASW